MTNNLEKFGFSDFAHQGADTASPVYPSLMSQMKAELVVNPESDVWLIYDRPLPEVMKWIEYDLDLETLTLVSISGKIQDFGMRVPPAMKKFLRRAKLIYAVHQGEDHIKDMSLVPLLVRDSIN
jgi:hypothetical protein